MGNPVESIQDKLNVLMKFSDHIKTDIRHSIGKCKLSNMLAHRVCTYNRYVNINKELDITDRFEEALQQDTFVEVEINCCYISKPTQSWEKPDQVMTAALAWAPTMEDAIDLCVQYVRAKQIYQFTTESFQFSTGLQMIENPFAK